MKKIREEIVEKIIVWHEFFCDNCGEKLGESEEDEDGDYRDFGRYTHLLSVTGVGLFRFRGCYCEKCAKIKDQQIRNSLLSIGFKEE